MFYHGYHFWGMHLIWWLIWISFILWLFATPVEISGRKKLCETPMDILKKRLASGQISTEEFEEKRKIIEIIYH